MPKKIRKDYTIYIAPDIIGYYDNNEQAKALDEKNNIVLNPNDIDDKIYIYKRQVKKWFLDNATRLVNKQNNGFIVLMICFSYLEGVEQYIQGLGSRSQSREFFKKSIQRIYNDLLSEAQIDDLYSEARCGLFHNGMVRGKILINIDFDNSISIPDSETILINPRKLLKDIKNDFNNYISMLRDKNNILIRGNFNNMFSNS